MPKPKTRTRTAVQPAADPVRASVDPVAAAADEGESQSLFFNPPAGGSYVRNRDGSLTRVEAPTAVPDFAPVERTQE